MTFEKIEGGLPLFIKLSQGRRENVENIFVERSVFHTSPVKTAWMRMVFHCFNLLFHKINFDSGGKILLLSAGHAAGIGDNVPHIVVIVHLYKNVTGHHTALNYFAFAVLE